MVIITGVRRSSQIRGDSKPLEEKKKGRDVEELGIDYIVEE